MAYPAFSARGVRLDLDDLHGRYVPRGSGYRDLAAVPTPPPPVEPIAEADAALARARFLRDSASRMFARARAGLGNANRLARHWGVQFGMVDPRAERARAMRDLNECRIALHRAADALALSEANALAAAQRAADALAPAPALRLAA